jgi:hypothetical protein
MAEQEKRLEQVVLTRLLRLNATLHGIVAGLVVGLGIFLATSWLILKGGPIGPQGQPVIGPHLSLLSQFFIGYRVTFLGSLIGFAYGFACGFFGGYFVARMYNWLADYREGKRRGHAGD